MNVNLEKKNKKQYIINFWPTVISIMIAIWSVILLLNNVVSVELYFGTLTDGTRSTIALASFLLLMGLSHYRMLYSVRKMNTIIFGLLAGLSLVNSNLGTLMILLVLLLYILYHDFEKRICYSFFSMTLVIGFFSFLVYDKGVIRDSLGFTLLKESNVVIVIILAILLISRPFKKARAKLAGTTSKSCYKAGLFFFSVLFFVFLFVSLMCKYGYFVTEYQALFANAYFGSSLSDFIMALGWKRRLVCATAVFVMILLDICLSVKCRKKQNVFITGFMIVLLIYSIFFSGMAGTFFVVFCNFVLLIMNSVKINVTVKTRICKKREKLILLVAGLLFYIVSFGLDDCMDYLMNTIYNQQTITLEDMLQRENSLKGFEVLDDKSLKSTEIDPWVEINFSEYGISYVYNVNLVSSLGSNTGESITIYALNSYETGDIVFRNGNNFVNLDFVQSEDYGLRIDLTGQKNQVIMLDKIVFNDFSNLSKVIAAKCRLIALIMLIVCAINFINELVEYFEKKSIILEKNKDVKNHEL